MGSRGRCEEVIIPEYQEENLVSGLEDRASELIGSDLEMHGRGEIGDIHGSNDGAGWGTNFFPGTEYTSKGLLRIFIGQRCRRGENVRKSPNRRNMSMRLNIRCERELSTDSVLRDGWTRVISLLFSLFWVRSRLFHQLDG